MAPPPSGPTTTRAASSPSRWARSAAAAGGAAFSRRRRPSSSQAVPKPPPERTTATARATTSSFAAGLGLGLPLAGGSCCCLVGESGIRWARVRRTCCEEILSCSSSFGGASPAFCGVVVSPPRACPCCAPACAGAPPPGCLCRLVPEREGGPFPSSSNVCVCSTTDLPRGRSPGTWGSPPRVPPRLAVHFVARKLRAIMSITSSSFSCIELVLTTSSSLNSLVPAGTVALCFILISQRCQMTHFLYKYLLECLLPYIL